MDCEIVRIRDTADIRRAASDFCDIATEAGMKVAACHDIARNEMMVDAEGQVLAESVFGWTDIEPQWWKCDKLALESPLTCVCRYESEAFWINGDRIRTRQPNNFVQQINLEGFEARAKTKAAVVAPVHLPFGQIGAVSFNPLDTDRVDLESDYIRYGVMFEQMARVFVSSYVHVRQRVKRLPPDSRLSPREVECLRWASVGKTDEEISMIMYRSRATVRFHLHNASVKLDAVNRSQTVYKAAQLGYISA